MRAAMITQTQRRSSTPVHLEAPLYRIILLIACITLFSEASLFAQTLLTDFNVHPLPSLPTINAAGDKVVDPTFGTTILRVSDVNDGFSVQAMYATYPAINANSTRVMGAVNLTSGGANRVKIWSFNASTFTVSGGAIHDGIIGDRTLASWSGTNPDILYTATSGNAPARLYMYNAATQTNTVLRDFSAILPANAGTRQVSHDLNDEYFSMHYTSASGNGYLLWRRSTNTILLNVANSTINETYVDKAGAFFMWIDNSNQAHVYSISGNVATVVGDAGHISHVGVGTRNAFTQESFDMKMRANLATPSTVTTLMAGYFSSTFQDSHHSMNANDESYGLTSRYHATYDGTRNANTVYDPFDLEIVQVASSKNAVRRIAHHRSVVTAGGDVPSASSSKDGQFVAFTSNWGGASGHNRRDLYLVKVPAAGGDSAPSSPTGLTVR